MEYVIIGACIVVAIAGGIVLYVKNKRTKNELGNTAVVVSKTSSSKLQASDADFYMLFGSERFAPNKHGWNYKADGFP